MFEAEETKMKTFKVNLKHLWSTHHIRKSMCSHSNIIIDLSDSEETQDHPTNYKMSILESIVLSEQN